MTISITTLNGSHTHIHTHTHTYTYTHIHTHTHTHTLTHTHSHTHLPFCCHGHAAPVRGRAKLRFACKYQAVYRCFALRCVCLIPFREVCKSSAEEHERDAASGAISWCPEPTDILVLTCDAIAPLAGQYMQYIPLTPGHHFEEGTHIHTHSLLHNTRIEILYYRCVQLFSDFLQC